MYSLLKNYIYMCTLQGFKTMYIKYISMYALLKNYIYIYARYKVLKLYIYTSINGVGLIVALYFTK